MFSCLGYEWMSGDYKTSHSAWVINSLPDHFQPGPDFFGIPWIAIIIVFLGISTLGIFLWKTSFGVSFLKTVLKLQNVHDRSTDVQRRAWRSNSRSQEGIKIGLEDLFTSWRYMEAKVRAEVHKVTTKVNSHYQIHGQRKTTEEHLRKLRMKECEQAEKERQLSDAEENGKLVMKKIRTYKKMFQDMQQLQWRTEDSYRCKITPYARKALDNWVCAQALQREMAERKAAYKQHGCEMREKQRMPERHMSQEPVQGRPGLKNRLWRADSGPHSVPMRNSSCVPAGNTEKTKVSMVAVEHHHSSGLRYSPYLMAEPLRQWMGHQPPPASQYHSPADDSLRLQTPPECLLVPLPPSPVDDFLRPQTPPVDCPLGPLPFSPAHDFLRLQTPPKCLLVPLPPSPADDFLRPQTPPVACPLGPFLFSPADDSLRLQTPPECLLVPLPPSPVDDFLRP
ncbi:nuclear pore complex-interacting protein family member A1-like isoform X5 [Macaca mulatta]